MPKPDHILLFVPEDKTKSVTIAKYEQWRDTQKRDEIADFIFERHYRRYLKPFEFNDARFVKEYKNGFAIMANCCLLIETLESFYRGWRKSKSELAFLKFFTRDKEFQEFSINDLPTQFYKNVRCGILHQGETRGGWKITREPNKLLLDETDREINAYVFHQRLKKSLENYRSALKSNDWDSELWKNLREKMKSIIKNCEY